MADRVGQQLGNYHLLRLLGRGAFAEVYLGEHLHLERPAAIKLLHVQMEQDTQEQFRREARTIAHLQHPHIVQVHDFGLADQTPYLVMEYTPGGTLRSRHPKGTQLPLEQIVSYVKQIASALDYAHEQRVIHRDVKPANLLLNARGEVVLSDFGLAVVQRTLESLSTQEPAGTPLYMAPEQIRHHPCTASDQYALGVMVYEWLCGEPPFHGQLYAVLGQHLSEPPPSLCQRLPDLPVAVEEAVFKALAKDPAQRFATVQDFALALEEACFTTQPLSVHTPIEAGSSDHGAQPAPHPLPVAREQDYAPPPQYAEPRTPLPAGYSRIVSERSHPVSVMCVCAPVDRSYLEQWETHLRLLEQAGYFTVWSEHHLLAGSPRQQQIDEHLDQAELIILLLSADFFSSDDCIRQMHRALHRRQNDGILVVPLLLRPVEWDSSPLAPLSCVPSNQLPVTAWTNRDAAFDWCVRDIRRLLGHPTPSAPRDQGAPASSVQHKNRMRLLGRVRSFWITGVLEHSLHGATLMALGLQEHPDAIANPWHLVLQYPHTAPLPLPGGTRITQVYDDADGELLILGAPGSGKTTLLLELARNLLERAERDEQHPMPVVFNLSSWSMKKQSLAEWLVEELNDKYQVPRKLGQALVDADQILPLLDGLDEVAARDRTACIEAINTYRQEHWSLPMVVCSRSADYLAQTTRVLLRHAVAVQPLIRQQVDAYLAKGKESLRALRVALHQDAALRELAETPLMLSILTLTYHGMPVEELLRGGIAPTRQQVFERYVERMLSRRGKASSYPPQQTKGWLAWLARQMKQQSQTVFYLERLQPDWLSDSRMLRAYHRWAIRLPGILIGMLVGLAITLWFVASTSDVITTTLLGSLLGGLLSGGGATPPSEAHGRKMRHLSWQQFLQRLVIGSLIGLAIGLSYWLNYGLNYWLSYELSIGLSPWLSPWLSPMLSMWVGPWLSHATTDVLSIELSHATTDVLSERLSIGLSIGLGGILLQDLLVKSDAAQPPSQTSPPIERTEGQHLIRSTVLRNGLLTGLLVWLSFGLGIMLDGLPNGLISGLGYGLRSGLGYGLGYGLTSGFIGGLLSLLLIGRSVTVQLTDRVIWSWKSLGQSLWSSQNRRAALLVAALVGLSIGLGSVLSIGLSVLSIGLSVLSFRLGGGITVLSSVLSFGLSEGLSLGLSIGLSYWFLSGLFQGVAGETIEDQQRVVPNQGIHRSAKNALVLGLISAMIVWLSYGLSFGLLNVLSNVLGNVLHVEPSYGLVVGQSYGLVVGQSVGQSYGLRVGLRVGLSIGLIYGLFMGGWACLRHSVLRFLLWRAGAMPWNYPRFLDYAAEQILLRKVGGGYIFVHRLLLEYFASLDTTATPDAARAKREQG